MSKNKKGNESQEESDTMLINFYDVYMEKGDYNGFQEQRQRKKGLPVADS